MSRLENVLEVNGIQVEITDEKSLLDVVRKAGIDLPTLCHVDHLSVFGGCRQCIVETDTGQIVSACSSPPTPGMKIKTHTSRVQGIRRMALELILAQHDQLCTTCGKSGRCRLQDLSARYGLDSIRFAPTSHGEPVDRSAAGLIHDPDKCILCGLCVRTCSEMQGISAIDFAFRGSNMTVASAFNSGLGDVDCVQCGQCAVVCPTGALMIKSETDRAWRALHDSDKVVVVQIAPAVRTALGESFDLAPGPHIMGQLVSALRHMGVDYVFDTVFAADLTVMEETAEFLDRVKKGGDLPLFTSCCPAWVKFAEHNYPDILPHLSTCKSPQQMFGSVIKQHFAKKLNVEPKDIYVISIMPCTAKKFEASRPEFENDGIRDVDLVLTTQEISRMIKESGIDLAGLPESSVDNPFGPSSGAGLIFGATGGVAEAVLRAAHWFVTGESLPSIEFTVVRGEAGLKHTTVDVAEHKVRIAVTHTLSKAREVIDAIRAGEAAYDIVEVMACPGGCVGGAGQPHEIRLDKRFQRSEKLYHGDRERTVRRAQENPAILQLYKEWLGEPNSTLAHSALHTTYTNRKLSAAQRRP